MDDSEWIGYLKLKIIEHKASIRLHQDFVTAYEKEIKRLEKG